MAIPSALMNLMGRRRVDPMITEDARNRAASAASGGTLPGGSGVPVGTVMAQENGQIVGGIRGAGTPQEMRIGDVMASSGPGLPAAPQAPAINQDFLAGRPAAGSGRIVPRADVKMTETDDGMGGKKTVKSYVWKGAELTMDQIMQPRDMAQFSDPMLAGARTGEVRRAMGLTPGGFGEAGLTNQERQRRLEAAMGPRPAAAQPIQQQAWTLKPGERVVGAGGQVLAEGAPAPAEQPQVTVVPPGAVAMQGGQVAFENRQAPAAPAGLKETDVEGVYYFTDESGKTSVQDLRSRQQTGKFDLFRYVKMQEVDPAAAQRYLLGQGEFAEAPAGAQGTPDGGLSPQDIEALNWANGNPNDPRAAEIKRRLGR